MAIRLSSQRCRQLIEQQHLLPLAAEGMDLARTSFPTVNSMGCVRVLTNAYSVPLKVGVEVHAKTYASTVEVWKDGHCVALHERCYGPVAANALQPSLQPLVLGSGLARHHSKQRLHITLFSGVGEARQGILEIPLRRLGSDNWHGDLDHQQQSPSGQRHRDGRKRGKTDHRARRSYLFHA